MVTSFLCLLKNFRAYNILLLCVFLFYYTQLSIGQELSFWNNPNIVNVNKLPARATSISYPTELLALKANKDASPRKLSLNGDWKFYWIESPKKAPKNFNNLKFSDNHWKTIPVPSNWELHGYGKPWQRLTPQIFKNFNISQPNVPEDYNPTGLYRKIFKLPKTKKNSQHILHIGAASSALEVWVNGIFVGYSEGNRLPSEFNITKYLKPNKNLIAFKVMQWCNGSYLEDQDHWRMSGITREVYIESVPNVQLYDFHVQTDLDENYTHAQLKIRPKIKVYNTTKTKDYHLNVQLYDANKIAVLDSVYKIAVNKIITEYHPPVGNRPFERLINIKVKNPKKWSAEFPNLYTLVFTITNKNKTVLEARSTKIGFREVDTSNGEFKVNGIPVLLYGVNRHDWDAKTGKVVSKETMRRDAQLMKQLNVNASRSSHYPNAPYWYELCDEYGIYVMDEANIETHGLGSLLSNTPSWSNAFLERGIRMVERNKNHPSIISWSLGNEAGFGPNHAALSAWIKEYDATRPIHAEGAQNIYGYSWPKPEPKDKIYTDIISRMYRLTDDMIDLATQPNDTRPVIWCEYAHSQGNSTGDLQGYWAAIRKFPRLVGGFVWDWRDQLIKKDSKDDKKLWRFGEDFKQKHEDLLPIQKGLISADGNIKSGGWQAKYIWQRVKIESDSISKGVFTLQNRHSRTNLNQYDISWNVTEDGVILKSGILPAPNIKPNSTGKIKINLPKINFNSNKYYHIKLSLILKNNQFWAKKGFEVATEQFLWVNKNQIPKPLLKTNNFNIVDKKDALNIIINNTVIGFNKVSGKLNYFGNKTTNYIKKPLSPNFWRAPTDNDLASGILKKLKIWKDINSKLVLKNFKYHNIKEHLIIETLYQDSLQNITLKLNYNIDASGKITVNYILIPKINLPQIPRIGLQLEVTNNLSELKWFGRGPLETYADKKTGAFFGAYKNNIKKDFTYYVRPQESSNKTDIYWAIITDKDGKGLKIEHINKPLNISMWPFTQKNIEQAKRIENLTFTTSNTLNIDYKQMGVGGDNTWNSDAAPHKPFTIPAKNYTYRFSIKLEQ